MYAAANRQQSAHLRFWCDRCKESVELRHHEVSTGMERCPSCTCLLMRHSGSRSMDAVRTRQWRIQPGAGVFDGHRLRREMADGAGGGHFYGWASSLGDVTVAHLITGQNQALHNEAARAFSMQPAPPALP
eukprot:Hpha_TRINITY_DN15618_c1_g1::TRINITY_DN15618_c1_g1_i1::g.100913::m.100913